MAKNQEIISDLYTLRAGLSYILQQSDNNSDQYQENIKNNIKGAYNLFYEFGGYYKTDKGIQIILPQPADTYYYQGYSEDHWGPIYDENDKKKRANNVPAPESYLYRKEKFTQAVYYDHSTEISDFLDGNSELLEGYKNALTKTKQTYERLLDENQKQSERISNKKGLFLSPYYAKRAILWAILCLVAVAGALYLGIFQFGFTHWSTIACFAVAGIFALICICIIAPKIITRKKQRQLGLEFQAEYAKAITICDKILSDLNMCSVENRALMAEQREREVKSFTEHVNEVYALLENRYAALLDPRDWKYLDLLIFYFETGRAESMREALQQVDREMQTQQIVGSIKAAAVMICRTIQSEMSSLRSTLHTGFASLQQSINSGFASLQGGIAANNMLLQQQLTETNLSNALQAKANMTSEQLMNDVHYLRDRLA